MTSVGEATMLDWPGGEGLLRLRTLDSEFIPDQLRKGGGLVAPRLFFLKTGDNVQTFEGIVKKGDRVRVRLGERDILISNVALVSVLD